MEKDFSQINIRVNTSGSWANLAVVNADDFDKAKDVLTELATLHRGAIRFKALDAEGGIIEQYAPTGHNGVSNWHEPKRRG